MDFQSYFKSHGDYLLATIRKAQDRLEVASKVQCVLSGNIFTVGDILLECNFVGGQGRDYKKWVNNADYVIQECIKEVTGVSREALQYAAGEVFYKTAPVMQAMGKVLIIQDEVEQVTGFNNAAMRQVLDKNRQEYKKAGQHANKYS